MSGSRWQTTLTKGARVIVGERFGVVADLTSMDVLIHFDSREFSVARHSESDGELVEVPWADFENQNAKVLMDRSSQAAWASLRTHNQRKLQARLAVVCLVLTGTRSGQVEFAGEGEPIEDLAPEPKPVIHPRAEYVAQLLRDQPFQWVGALVTDLNATTNPHDGTVHRPPSVRTIENWVANLGDGGVFALNDNRGGDRTAATGDDQRRRDTERLVGEVLAARSPRRSSAKSRGWVMRRVRERARDQKVLILDKGQLRSLVSARLVAEGRTPLQMKAAKVHRQRVDHQSKRPSYPGQVLAFDETWSDNFVRMTPDGPPLRCHIQVAVDAATGVFTAAHATGAYKSIHVGLSLHDAFRPILLVPDPDGVVRPRMKGSPEAITGPRTAFVPGAIAARLRSDNIVQNHSNYMLGIARNFGCDISPSRKGVSKDNSYAEAAISALRGFLEDGPAYTGRNTTERAPGAHEDGVITIDEFEANLQQFCFVEHNHAPTPVPMYTSTGMSRLQHWDLMIDQAGAPPMLLNRNALFSFLEWQQRKLTSKGLELNSGHHYSCPELFGLPRHVMGDDRLIWVVSHPLLPKFVWVPDPVDNTFLEVPNVLNELSQAPLTAEISALAKRRARLDDLDSHHATVAFAHVAEAILRDPDHGARIERELADWRSSLRQYSEALRNGASVIRPNVGTRWSGASPVQTSATDQSVGPPTGPRGRDAGSLDPLDRPITPPAGWT